MSWGGHKVGIQAKCVKCGLLRKLVTKNQTTELTYSSEDGQTYTNVVPECKN